jgi:hypothetical protein
VTVATCVKTPVPTPVIRPRSWVLAAFVSTPTPIVYLVATATTDTFGMQRAVVCWMCQVFVVSVPNSSICRKSTKTNFLTGVNRCAPVSRNAVYQRCVATAPPACFQRTFAYMSGGFIGGCMCAPGYSMNSLSKCVLTTGRSCRADAGKTLEKTFLRVANCWIYVLRDHGWKYTDTVVFKNGTNKKDFNVSKTTVK